MKIYILPSPKRSVKPPLARLDILVVPQSILMNSSVKKITGTAKYDIIFVE